MFVDIEFLQVRAFHVHRRTPTNTAGIRLVGVPVGVRRWACGGLPRSAHRADGGRICYLPNFYYPCATGDLGVMPQVTAFWERNSGAVFGPPVLTLCRAPNGAFDLPKAISRVYGRERAHGRGRRAGCLPSLHLRRGRGQQITMEPVRHRKASLAGHRIQHQSKTSHKRRNMDRADRMATTIRSGTKEARSSGNPRRRATQRSVRCR